MKRLISVLFILLLTLPLTTSAETNTSPLKMEELSIQVLPEYSYHPKDTKKNKTPLLIGYQGTLLNESNKAQKGQIEIPLPKDQKNLKVGFVADYSSDLSEMYEIEYEYDRKNRVISWKTSTDILPGDLYKFVIEFYSDEMKKKSNVKSLDYTFTSFADIPLVNITFLEPLKSESTKLTPDPETHQENPYGMNMFMYEVKGMKKGDEKTYQLTYKRTVKDTTVELMNKIDENHEQKSAEPKKVESKDMYIVIGCVGAFSLIAVFVLIFFLKRKKQTVIKPISKSSEPTDEKSQLRSRLIQGEISKDEYDQLIKKIK